MNDEGVSHAHGMNPSSLILHTSSFGFFDLRGRTSPRACPAARRSPPPARPPLDNGTPSSPMTRIDLTGQHFTALPELPEPPSVKS